MSLTKFKLKESGNPFLGVGISPTDPKLYRPKSGDAISATTIPYVPYTPPAYPGMSPYPGSGTTSNPPVTPIVKIDAGYLPVLERIAVALEAIVERFC